MAFVQTDAAKEIQKELETYAEDCESKNFRPNPIFIFGASGAGKTRLGLHAAQALAPSSPTIFPRMIPGYFHVAVDNISAGDYGIEDNDWLRGITADAVEQKKEDHSRAAAKFLALHLVARNRHPKVVYRYKSKSFNDVLQEWASSFRQKPVEAWFKANCEQLCDAKLQARSMRNAAERRQADAEILGALQAAAAACEQAARSCAQARDAAKDASAAREANKVNQASVAAAEEDDPEPGQQLTFEAAKQACDDVVIRCEEARQRCAAALEQCTVAAKAATSSEEDGKACEAAARACAMAIEGCEQVCRACDQACKCKVPVYLMVHLDEFHDKPWASACMARAVRCINAHLTDGVLAVPVLTGLTTARTRRLTEKITGRNFDSVYLRYLEPLGKDAMNVVINAFRAEANEKHHDELNEDHFKEVSWLWHHLDDASGWTLALVRLGAVLGLRMNDVKKPFSAFDHHDIRNIERITANLMRGCYSRDDLYDGIGISSEGLPKLILAAIAPFRVCSECVRVCVCARAFVLCVCARARVAPERGRDYPACLVSLFSPVLHIACSLAGS